MSVIKWHINGAMTFTIMNLRIMPFSKMTLSNMSLDAESYYAEYCLCCLIFYCYGESHHAGCCYAGYYLC